MEAQYELGEMFHQGVFCDHIYVRFARNYIRRASVQGHVEAIARMVQLRSCVMCSADDARLACARCHQARYCDSSVCVLGKALVRGRRRGWGCEWRRRGAAQGHLRSHSRAEKSRQRDGAVRHTL